MHSYVVWDIDRLDRLSSVTTTKSLVQHQIQSIDEKRDSRGASPIDVVRVGFSQRNQISLSSSIRSYFHATAEILRKGSTDFIIEC